MKKCPGPKISFWNQLYKKIQKNIWKKVKVMKMINLLKPWKEMI